MKHQHQRETHGMHTAVEMETKCGATYVHSQTVIEHLGDSEFARAVEVYALHGCNIANRAYAWQVERSIGKTPEYKVVLGVPPINSAEHAVRSVVKRLEKSIKKWMLED